MSRFATLDLSRVAPPPVVQAPDFEAILTARKANIVERLTLIDADIAAEVEAILTLESEPAVKIQETGAYRETLHYARVNSAALAVMLAFAAGGDLDALGAYYGVERLVITPANPSAGIAAVLEDDARLRRRIQIAPEALSTAGPVGAYEFHALTVSNDILDAGIAQPAPGTVHVHLVTRAGNGAPSDDLLRRVAARFRDDNLVPLTDNVSVRSAVFLDYQISATLVIGRGPDPTAVRNEATAALNRYLAGRRRVGMTIARSGIIAALHVASVDRVELALPAADIVAARGEYARVGAVAVTTEVLE